MLQTVYYTLGYLNKEAETIQLEGSSFLTGVKKSSQRSEKCYQAVMDKGEHALTLIASYFILGEAIINTMYIKKHFDMASTAIVEDMMERIRYEYNTVYNG